MEWTASLCIFSVPALWNSSPTANHNDAIYTLYVADSLAANETHTLWFLMFDKSTGGSVAVYVVDNALFHCIIEFLFKAVRPIL